jgi:hypothetical protein
VIIIGEAFDILLIGLCLLVSLWTTAHAYVVVDQIRIGNYRIGNPVFRSQMQWLGPFVIILCVAAIAFSIWGRQLPA